MADSRSSLRAPAEVSDSGRCLLPSSTLPHPFSCRVCGGTDFTTETRPGVVVAIHELQMHQGAGFGDLAGTHRVFTCVRCASAIAEAHASVQAALLGDLLFSARDLAHNQFCRPVRSGQFRLQCTECRTLQHGEARSEHTERCRVGRVLRLIDALIELEKPAALREALRAGGGELTPFLASAMERGGVQ
ncbi:MAG TPA: hypothetical protein VGT04_04000 [Acidobacteriaceae bacterium]|nr:hypothetical protein [Acidobacteriaceae bacterium]